MNDKIVIVTGANGNLGSSLVKELADNSAYKVLALARTKDKMHDAIERSGITNKDKIIVSSYEEFFAEQKHDSNIFAAVHMAFSRAGKQFADIADSLEFSKLLYRKLHELHIPRIVYTSSQSVYGSVSCWRAENIPAAPETVYSMAKYAGEKLLEEVFEEDDSVKYSSLRLDYVIQSQKLVYTLCRNAKMNGELNLKGGKQTFSYIDKTDVAKAVVKLLDHEGEWKRVYNVGHDKMRYTLIGMSDIVLDTAKKFGKDNIQVNIDENDTELWSGMDSMAFMEDTGWKPTKDIYQMVEEIYEEIC